MENINKDAIGIMVGRCGCAALIIAIAIALLLLLL